MNIHRAHTAPPELQELLGQRKRDWIAVVPGGGQLVGLDHWEKVVSLGVLEDGSNVYAGSDPVSWREDR